MHSVLCMVFNHVKNELITGGTGGMKVNFFGVSYKVHSNGHFSPEMHVQ